MAERVADESIDSNAGEARKNRVARKTGTPAERLLLQQHQSLLMRVVASQFTHRAINTVLVVISLVSLMGGPNAQYPSLAPIASLWVASLVACLWYFEQRLLAMRLTAIERSLAKRTKYDFENIYIYYKFESTSGAAKFWALRFEPLLWLAALVANAVLSMVMHSTLR
jgi:hypothetical protein